MRLYCVKSAPANCLLRRHWRGERCWLRRRLVVGPVHLQCFDWLHRLGWHRPAHSSHSGELYEGSDRVCLHVALFSVAASSFASQYELPSLFLTMTGSLLLKVHRRVGHVGSCCETKVRVSAAGGARADDTSCTAHQAERRVL